MITKNLIQTLTATTISICLLFCHTNLRAEEVVRINITSNTVAYSVDLTLFDEIAPTTVGNFLTYVNDGDYTNSFIHRNDIGFVLQGGGFTYDPTVGDGLFTYGGPGIYNGGLQEVPTDPAILNEYKKSNATGTIAMAQTNNPDSATSQWFINMDNNSFTLDATGGPFTAFGKVLAEGMDTFNLLSNVPPINTTIAHPDFTDLPLNNLNTITIADDINDSHLVMIRDIVQLYRIDTRVDFGPPVIATPVIRTVSITNYNVVPITIDTIDVSGIAAEFSIDVSACSNQTLLVNQSCDMSATLTPTSTNPHASNFNVTVSDPGHSFIVNLTTPAPNIDPAFTTLDFGDQQLLDTEQIVLIIDNIGDSDLAITSVSLAGATPSDFSFTDNCTTKSPLTPGTLGSSSLPPPNLCVLPVNFTPTSNGIINAELQIESDDPDTPTLIIPLTGTSLNDLDGVADAIEDNAPNSGDGNNDEVFDRYQSDVTSFVDSSDSYITLVSETILDLSFSNISLVDLATLPIPPTTTNFKNAAFAFDLSGTTVTKGFTTDVLIILPSATKAKDVFLYGPSTDDSDPHWHSLQDSLSIVNNGELASPSDGSSIKRNFVFIQIIDGGNGDADGVANGVIAFKGALDIGSSSGGSGGVMYLTLLLFGLLPLYLRYKHYSLIP